MHAMVGVHDHLLTGYALKRIELQLHIHVLAMSLLVSTPAFSIYSLYCQFKYHAHLNLPSR